MVAMYVTAINGRHLVVIQSSDFFSAVVCAIVYAPSALL
jgi:hypothetical protein